MKVILNQDVKGLGKRGQAVEVATGYGRNYLIPRGLAVEASSGALKNLQAEQSQQERKKERELAELQALRARINGQTVTIQGKAGEAGRLFGSVTSKDVAEAIKAAFKADIDRKKIEIPDQIKTLGNHSITVRLGPNIVAELTVQIVGE